MAGTLNMKKTISILIVIIMLLSGCISKDNKYSDNRNGSNQDEYSTVEEDNSGVIPTEYDNLDLNNKNLKTYGSNVKYKRKYT